jgi:hypothetical protein
MENLTVRDLMVPADKFPKISERASFYEALAALESAQDKYLSGKSEQRILLVENEFKDRFCLGIVFTKLQATSLEKEVDYFTGDDITFAVKFDGFVKSFR